MIDWSTRPGSLEAAACRARGGARMELAITTAEPRPLRRNKNSGELLKLGFEIAQSSVAKYMVKRRGPPSQGWHTFLRNHAPNVAAMDMFVVLTLGFDLLYALVIVRLGRRDLVWIDVTASLSRHRGMDTLQGYVKDADLFRNHAGTGLL